MCMLNRLFYLMLLAFVVSCGIQDNSSNVEKTNSVDDQTPKLAKIGKQTITEQALKLELAALPGGEARASRPGGHRAELERLIDLMVAEKEGITRKINEDLLYQQRVAKIKAKARREERELMYEMLYQKFSESSAIPDDKIKAYYEKHKNRFLTTRIHLRRISAKTRGEVEIAQQRLDKGEAFEKVASSYNTDEGLRESGGDMGAVLRNDLPTNLRVAAFQLQKENEIGSAFESEDTWNILQLIKKETGVTRPLEAVKDQLVRELKRTHAKQTLTQVLKSRREQMGVTLYEDQVAKLGPPMIPVSARPSAAATQLKVPEVYQAQSAILPQKQVESSLQKDVVGH